MPGQPPPVPPVDPSIDPYGGRGPELIGVCWMFVGITTILLVLRILVRIKIVERGWMWSLGWACLAWLFGLISVILVTVAATDGLGNHTNIDLEAGTLPEELKIFFTSDAFNGFSIVAGRCSVIAYLLGIQGSTQRYKRWFMYFLAASNWALIITAVIISFTQCRPFSGLWNVLEPHTCPLHEANYAMTITTGSYGAASDLFLALYPVLLVYKLQMRLRLKIFLSFLMGLGVFTAGCGIAKTYEFSVTLDGDDTTWTTVPLDLWAQAEGWLMLIASSPPALWPLFKKTIEKMEGKSVFRISTVFLKSLVTRSSKSGSSRGGDEESGTVTGQKGGQSSSTLNRHSDAGRASRSEKSVSDIEMETATPELGIKQTREIVVQREPSAGPTSSIGQAPPISSNNSHIRESSRMSEVWPHDDRIETKRDDVV